MSASETAERVAAPPRARRERPAPASPHRRRDLIVLGVLVVAAIVLVHSSAFSARHVRVEGAVHTSAAAVLRAGDIGPRTPLVDLGAQNVAAIERLPWVRTARIERHYPDSVTVVITERRPLATVAVGRELALVDASGRVLADLRAGASVPPGLVALGGVGAPPAPGATIAETFRPLLAVAAALPATLYRDVATVDLEPARGVVLRLSSGALVVFASATNLHDKYVALATLEANGALGAGVVADLRVPSAPVLNP